MCVQQDNIEVLKRIFNTNDGRQFEPYIRYMRFPQYKNLSPNSQIDFEFPITALVGHNGCNKSSVLQALFGAPANKSVGNYWFSTDVDQISKESRHCFIYGYKSLYRNQMVEVLKSRIQREGKPEYWEPARPQKEYGMQEMPPMEKQREPDRSKTRWNAINKEVLYLDFRHNLPAFDRFFYMIPFKRTPTFKNKQDYIRRYSKNLNKVIVSQRSEYSLYNSNKVNANYMLTPEKIDAINKILGKKYTRIQIVKHSFYGGGDEYAKTIITSDDDIKYSEAFAGSGESSVITLIDEIMSAKEKTLILLDEPETSLHPSAQKQMMDFIVESVKRYHHQVVIATHSPFFVQKLPPQAIKLLVNEDEGVRIIPSAYPDEAFGLLGAEELAKRTVFVEDKLAKYIVDRHLAKKHPNLKNSITVRPIGGADTIITRYIYPYSQVEKDDVVFLLDGDQDYKRRESSNQEIRGKITGYFDVNQHFDERRIPESDNPELENIFKEITIINANKVFCVNGNNGSADIEQKYTQIRKFLTYWFKHVRFLDDMTPEKAIISNLSEDDKNELYLGETDIDTSVNGKEVFKKYTEKEFDTEDVSGEEIYSTQKRFVARLEPNCDLFQSVEKALDTILGDELQ